MYKRVCFRKAKQFHHQRRFIVPSLSPPKSGNLDWTRTTDQITHKLEFIIMDIYGRHIGKKNAYLQVAILWNYVAPIASSNHSLNLRPRICLLRIFSNSSKSGRNLNVPRSPLEEVLSIFQHIFTSDKVMRCCQNPHVLLDGNLVCRTNLGPVNLVRWRQKVPLFPTFS